jgi:hypothetical protein
VLPDLSHVSFAAQAPSALRLVTLRWPVWVMMLRLLKLHSRQACYQVRSYRWLICVPPVSQTHAGWLLL